MLGRVTEKPQIWNGLHNILLIFTPVNFKTMFLGVLLSGDSETQVPSILWLHYHQHLASKTAGEEPGVSHVGDFYGLDIEVSHIIPASFSMITFSCKGGWEM